MKFLVTLISLLSISFSALAQGALRCSETAKGVPLEPSGSWGLQSFLIRLDKVQDFHSRVQKLSDEEKIKLIFSEDARGYFFQMQALARLYKKKDKAFFEPLQAEVKAVEDHIGAEDLWMKLKALTAQLKPRLKTAQAIKDLEKLEKFFTKKEADASVKLFQDIKSWDDKKVAQVREKLMGFSDWEMGRDDQKFLVKRISKELEDIQADVADMKFDNPDIEKGLHELRRQLRWVVIDVLSLNRLVRYQEEPELGTGVQKLFEQSRKLNPQILTNRYMKIDAAVVSHPILIPLRMQGILTDMVDTIGKLKDGSEIQVQFLDAFKELEIKQVSADEIMSALNAELGLKPIDHQALSRQFQRTLLDSGLLVEYARVLNKLN